MSVKLPRCTAVSQVASFRDPAGRLLQREGRMLRLVAEEGLENAHFFLRSPVVRAFREAGWMEARILSPEGLPAP